MLRKTAACVYVTGECTISLPGGYMAYRPQSSKERIQHRLRIALGHLQKVHDMVADDAYCIAIIHQSQAVQKALQNIDQLILEEHLRGCVTDAIKNGNSEHAVAEVLSIFEKRR